MHSETEVKVFDIAVDPEFPRRHKALRIGLEDPRINKGSLVVKFDWAKVVLPAVWHHSATLRAHPWFARIDEAAHQRCEDLLRAQHKAIDQKAKI